MPSTAARPSTRRLAQRARPRVGSAAWSVVMVVALAGAMVGCGSESGSDASKIPSSTPAIETADPKIPVPASPDVAAVYVTLTNASSKTDTLESVTTDAGGHAELHRSFSEDGSAMMKPAGPISIHGGATLTLAPGGYHIMIMKPSRALQEGDHVQVDLEFRRAGKVSFDAPVVPTADVLGGGGTSGHSGNDDHSSGH